MGAGEGLEENDVLDLLSGLVNKSLVEIQATEHGEVRYRMLEPVRQYAQEKLEESGDLEAVRDRHAASFLVLAEEAEASLDGPRHDEWMGRLALEHDNLRGALGWLFAVGDVELRLRLSGALGVFWHMRGHLREGRWWLETALASTGERLSSAQVKVLRWASYLAWEQSDYRRSITLSEKLLVPARKLGNKIGLAYALCNLGMAAMFQE